MKEEEAERKGDEEEVVKEEIRGRGRGSEGGGIMYWTEMFIILLVS